MYNKNSVYTETVEEPQKSYFCNICVYVRVRMHVYVLYKENEMLSIQQNTDASCGKYEFFLLLICILHFFHFMRKNIKYKSCISLRILGLGTIPQTWYETQPRGQAGVEESSASTLTFKSEYLHLSLNHLLCSQRRSLGKTTAVASLQPDTKDNKEASTQIHSETPLKGQGTRRGVVQP